ncbi:VacJ family lipoprotein [Halomonas beimenensis]|uniref:Outer-membrane-phospholipid-binding lipoprotein MlaA n=1 Tax=Halomonas beimenensis TaxID=475662 RepID=A0A291P8S3_9GAMM|nr:VacJ family lipoprotein [Halomonas beimenensis]ATJ83258.1 outer-membrane-phospholipid-binding lipoprotein MlaA [Halomonas beimenensis]
MTPNTPIRRAGRGLAALCALALLSGCASQATVERAHPDDPWEGFNRKVFAFNETLDRYALKPVAQGYRFVTPDPVETGIGNFFSNLGEIRTTLNSLLQGKGTNASVATGRFLINSTLGVAGFFDVATRLEVTGREEDFGQTLAVWGVGEGPYVVLPLLGPSTVRDTAGLPVDSYTDPLTHVEEDKVRYSLRALDIIDTRAGLLDQERLIRGDRYSFIRDSWLQRRRFEVNDGEMGEDPFAEDDFGFDGEDFDDAFAE